MQLTSSVQEGTGGIQKSSRYMVWVGGKKAALLHNQSMSTAMILLRSVSSLTRVPTAWVRTGTKLSSSSAHTCRRHQSMCCERWVGLSRQPMQRQQSRQAVRKLTSHYESL